MIDLIDVIEVFEETTLYCCGLLYLSLILTRYKVYNLRGKQVENKLLKTQVARCAKKMLMLVDGFSPNGPTTCETLDLLSWGPYSQSINDWYLGTFEFGHSESTLDPNVSFWTKLCVLDPINLFKRPKDQFLTNADALLLGFEQVLVGHWIGGKNREAKFLNFCPYRTWRNSSNFVTNLMLFFCPGLHLLRFLDTDTARKKTIQQIIRKHDMCVCVWWFRDFFFHVLWKTRRDAVKKNMSRFHTMPIQMAMKNHGALLRLEHIVSLLSRQATSASRCGYHFKAHVVYTYII